MNLLKNIGFYLLFCLSVLTFFYITGAFLATIIKSLFYHEL